MLDLPELLRGFIERSFANPSAFAEDVGVDRGLVSRILNGKQAVAYRAAEEWADALDLNERDRADFFLAVALAHSRPIVRDKVASLERELATSRREREVLREKLAKIRAATRRGREE